MAKRGGQPGNSNALKHGFYSKHYESDDAPALAAFLAEGLEEEIAMLRVATRKIFGKSDISVNMIDHVAWLQALGDSAIKLATLIKSSHYLTGDDDNVTKSISEAISETIEEMRRKNANP
jgi:hypothetical protein